MFCFSDDDCDEGVTDDDDDEEDAVVDDVDDGYKHQCCTMNKISNPIDKIPNPNLIGDPVILLTSSVCINKMI